MTDRLYRSPTDRVIAGVAGGLAVYLNLDPSLVRVAWVLLAILSGGIFVLVYIVMMIVVPLPPQGWMPRPRSAGGAWPAGGSGWAPGSSNWSPGSTGWAPGGDAGPSAGPTDTADGPPPQSPSSGAVPGWQAGDGSTWGAGPGPAWTPPRVDGGSAGIVLGAVLVLLGAWFLVERYIDVDWNVVWPVVVIGLGVALMVGAMRRSRN